MNRRTFSTSLIFIVIVSCGDDWPPAVSTVQEIEALHASNLAVRCVQCGDDEIRALTERRDLESVVLDSAASLTHEGFAEMVEIDDLIYLFVEDASSLSDVDLDVLGTAPRLKNLYLYDGTGFSGDGLFALSRNPSLKHVIICNAPQIRDDAVRRFSDELPGCKIQVIDPPCSNYLR